MRLVAGERSPETGTFICVECSRLVRAAKGERLPNCPCGRDEYELQKRIRLETGR